MSPVTRRPATSDDAGAVYALVERTMREVVVATFGAWDEARTRREVDAWIAEGILELLEAGRALVGAVAIARREGDVALEELYVAPEQQGRGVGTAIVRALQAEAAAARKPVVLRVLRPNRARSLYERLGFVVVRETPERLFMEWRPTPGP